MNTANRVWEQTHAGEGIPLEAVSMAADSLLHPAAADSEIHYNLVGFTWPPSRQNDTWMPIAAAG